MPPSRIDELRRRVQSDPASIAFAQLAEEYRRSGQTEEAVRVCREGLTRHPGYLSARVTLGRALLDLGQLMGAREELEFVVAEAPENLAAVRGLAEIGHREGNTAEALTYYQRALTLARHDPEIEEIVQQLSRQAGAAAAGPGNGLSFEEAHQELLSAAERVPLAAPQPLPQGGRDASEGSTAPFDFDRLVAALGSPAAPPQAEAAVEGRAATVPIELHDPTSRGPDPFAALEAELRSSDAREPIARIAPWSPPDTETADPPGSSDWLPVSEPGDTDAHAPPDADAHLTPDGGAYAAPSAADVLADTLLTDDAVETPADAPDDASGSGAAMSDPFHAGDDGATPAESQPEAAAWEADGGTSPLVAADEALMPVLPAQDAASPMSPGDDVASAALQAEEGSTSAVLQTQEGGPPESPDTPGVTPAASAQSPEGVLDELESWLTTLADKSSQ